MFPRGSEEALREVEEGVAGGSMAEDSDAEDVLSIGPRWVGWRVRNRTLCDE